MKKYSSYFIITFILLLLANLLLAIYDQFNFLIPLLVGSLLFLVLKFWTILYPISRAKRVNFYLLLFSSTFALILGETFLRLHGKYYTHYEKQHHRWKSNFQSPPKENGYLHLWSKNTSIIDSSHNEFSYKHKTNSLGLLGPEPERKKKPAFYRIIGLGDSFTQGVGSPADSTWLKQMESKLNADTNTQNVYSLNAGVAGSDPFFEFQLLKRLEAYEADLLIMVVNRSDINDFFIRGGWERFKADSTTQYKAAPWYESIYRISHLSRLLIHDILKKNNRFQSQREREVFEQGFLNALEHVALQTQALCKARHMDFMLVFHPILYDFKRQASPFSSLIPRLSKKGIKTLDLYETFLEKSWINNKNYASYFWPIDRHFNARGYHYMGLGIADEIKNLNLIPLKATQE